jgi:hypothetical protein
MAMGRGCPNFCLSKNGTVFVDAGHGEDVKLDLRIAQKPSWQEALGFIEIDVYGIVDRLVAGDGDGLRPMDVQGPT